MTQVAIVGAGIVGLAIADELTRAGAVVDLFEKESETGTEASWAAAGILSPQTEVTGPGPFLDLMLMAHSLIPETVVRLQSLSGIDLSYRASGTLGVALSDSDEKELEQQGSWQKKAGIRVERLSASQVKSLEPNVDGAVRWGFFWPQTAQINNRGMVEAYRKAVRKQGATIHRHQSVRRFLLDKETAVGVETDQGEIRADWIVNAAGSWAGFDATLPFQIPVIPVKGQILQFRSKGPVVRRVVKSPRAYLVQRTPEQLIVGTTVERVGFDKSVTSEGKESIREGIREISSAIDSCSFETAWAGLRPGTPDGLPILGASPVKNLLCATGHYRNGILLAPLTGRIIAEQIVHGRSSIDLSPFGVERFSQKPLMSQ